MRILNFYLLTVLGLFIILPGYAQVIINEISYNPPEAGNDSLEFIEIYNAGPGHVDITGWHFTGGIADTFPSYDLNGNEFYVTAINAHAMLAVYGVNVRQWQGGALNNAGESIRLVDAAGNLVDSVLYDDLPPWPLEPDGFGPSLELKDPELDNNNGANWQFSGAGTGIIINGSEVSGTPGAENSGGGVQGPEVTINLANFQFDPKNAVVAIGDSVRWVNNETLLHNVNGQQSVYPDNPESFFSGVPAAGPWQYDHEFLLPGLYDYRCDAHLSSGMVGTVSVYDPDGYTDFPLELLRLTDVNGSHIFTGVPTRVTGVVHGINFQPSGYSFYIINPGNVGINVFSFDPGSYVVTEGDMVRVSGEITQFNGLLEIGPDTIEVLTTGNLIVPPTSVIDLSEEIEASHIVFGTYLIDSIVGTGVTGYNVYVTHDEGTKALIRVDADLGIDLPQIENSNIVRGIGTQFDSSFPFTSGYQILALQFSNFTGTTVIADNAVSMMPNPANNVVSLKSDYHVSEIQIFSLDGKNIKRERMDGYYAEMNIAEIPEGLYAVKALTEVGIWTALLSIVR